MKENLLIAGVIRFFRPGKSDFQVGRTPGLGRALAYMMGSMGRFFGPSVALVSPPSKNSVFNINQNQQITSRFSSGGDKKGHFYTIYSRYQRSY